MRKKLILLLLFTISSYLLSAQNFWYYGYIFSKENTKIEAVPFATIYFCDLNNHDDILYVGFTDLSGQYDIGSKVKERSFFIKVVAPSYKLREKSISEIPKSHSVGKNPQKWRDGFTLHIKMDKIQGENLDKKDYLKKDLNIKNNNILEMLASIPGVIREKNNFYTKSDGAIKILLNGYSMPIQIASNFSKLPVSFVEKIEYYDLEKYTDSKYQAVINVVINKGDRAQSIIKGGPMEINAYDI